MKVNYIKQLRVAKLLATLFIMEKERGQWSGYPQ